MNQVISRIFCENHNKEVRYICCDLNCNSRIFCGQCLRSETHASHSEKIFALEEFVNESEDDVWQVFQKNKRSNFLVDELSHLVEQKKRDLIQAIEREFKELQVTLHSYSESFEREKEKISEIQKVVKEYLQHQVQASDVKSSFDNFKNHFNEQINSFKEFDFQQFSWQQQQLLESFNDLKSRLFTTYQVVDEEWLNEIKQNMLINLQQVSSSSVFFDDVQKRNIQKYEQLKAQNNNCVLVTNHFKHPNYITKFMNLRMNKPIKQLKISFQIKGILDNPIFIKFINEKYEGILEIDYKKYEVLFSGSNPLQNQQVLVNLSEKKFSFILNKESPFMILNMDNNNTFIKLNGEDKNLIKKNQSEPKSSNSNLPMVNMIMNLTKAYQNSNDSNVYSGILQNSYNIFTLYNYPSKLEILGIHYLLE